MQMSLGTKIESAERTGYCLNSLLVKKKEEISTIFLETTRMYKSGLCKVLNLQPSSNPQRVLFRFVYPVLAAITQKTC